QVKEVQRQREQRFFENRFRGAKAKEKAAIKAEIADNIELIAPAAANREKALLNITEKAKQVRLSWARRPGGRLCFQEVGILK
ncbi:unnamed protein product, partial [Choristocarpus tenellus]